MVAILFGSIPSQLMGVNGVAVVVAVSVVAGLANVGIGIREGQQARMQTTSDWESLLRQFLRQSIEPTEFIDKLSRRLWLEGSYKLRVKFGEAIIAVTNEMRSKLKRSKKLRRVRLNAFIDAIGWTNVERRSVEIGRKNIETGIQEARLCNDFYWQAKGTRHLAGICLREYESTGNDVLLESAQGFLEEAQALADRITDLTSKREMRGGIKQGWSDYYILVKRFQDAEENLIESEKAFRENSDYNRLARVNYRFGRVYEEEGNLTKAIERYKQGLLLAKTFDRRIEIIRNARRLENIYKKLGQADETANVQREIEEAEELPEHEELDDL